MSGRKLFPNASSGPITGDPFGRTWAELDHWFKLQGTGLYEQCCALRGRPASPREKKEALRELAKDAGMGRPSKGEFGEALRCYIGKANATYDAVFAEEIKQLRPDWFVNSADRKKTKLRELAAGEGKKPSRDARDLAERQLAEALNYYTREGRSTYDCDFTVEIQQLRPEWFVGSKVRKKAELFLLAKSGCVRPTGGRVRPTETTERLAERQLAAALRRYTNKWNAYDPSFDEEIRQLRPDWFAP